MKYNIIVACLMISMSAQAQDCTKESLLKKPGTWKAGPQGSVRNISTTDLTKEKLVIATIHKMVWLITYKDTLPFYNLSRKEYLLIQKKRLEKALQDSPGDRDYIGKFLNNITEYLKKPEIELNKAAVCMWNDEERFEKFVEEGTRGSFIAAKPNLMYYRKNLQKSAPQFFSVVYKITHGETVYEENIANIQKAVDFEKLKALPGK